MAYERAIYRLLRLIVVIDETKLFGSLRSLRPQIIDDLLIVVRDRKCEAKPSR